MKITNEMIAYAIGYFEGRHYGCEETNYDPADPCRHYYNAGYESGVGDYCRFDEEAVFQPAQEEV
jgi:hypothetical protein